MPEISPDAVLLRYMPANADFIDWTPKGDIESFETGWLSRRHFERGGASFYVKDILAEAYPEVASVAGIVATCGSAFAALSAVAHGAELAEWPGYCVAAVPVASIDPAAFSVEMAPTDIPIVGTAHAVVSTVKGISSLTAVEFRDIRDPLLDNFSQVWPAPA